MANRTDAEQAHDALVVAVGAAQASVRAAGEAVGRAVDALALQRTLATTIGPLPDEVARRADQARLDARRTVAAAAALVGAIEHVLGEERAAEDSPADALGALYLRFAAIAAEHEEEAERMRDLGLALDDGSSTPAMHDALAAAWRSASRIVRESFERVKGSVPPAAPA